MEAPAPEQPAPAAEAPAPEQPAPAHKRPAPAAEQPAPAPAEQPAPPAAEQPAAPAEQPAAPAEQPAAPAEQPAAPAAQPAAPAADIGPALQAQVDAYNGAIADLIGGGDAAAAKANIAGAKAQIDALCSGAGFPDTNACLANYGLELPAVPGGAAAAPAEQPAAPAVEVTAPTETPAEVKTEEKTEQSGAPVVLDQAVELVDPSIPAQDVAPLLDSAKDDVNQVTGIDGAVAAPAAETPAAAAEPVAPPPVDDSSAQAKFTAPAQIAPAVAEQGQALAVAPVAETPQNVTIINNTTTVVNNNTTNNNTTTNNTTNNTQNNTVNNTNVTQVVDNSVKTQVILQVGNQVIIRNPQQDRDRFVDNQEDQVYYEQLARGRVRETIERPDGSKIVTIRNRNGDILQRSRITADGREYVLAYFDESNEDNLLEWRDPGRDLPPLRLTIPVRDYVLDSADADEQQVDTFFRQPPVEQVQRLYSIDEVKRSARVRDSVRRLEVGGLTFDSGKATVARDQIGALGNVAKAMQAALDRNPAETFLIEGHTDAVGADLANLKLSDLRAATVARILTDFYDIPPENLATQGYGERYLKVKTEAAERQNRRVTIRRITPLVTPVASK